jgi:hypothetical protein
MNVIHESWKELLNDCIHVILISGTVGIALKLTTFLDKWVYFPWFPNVFDAGFLIFSVTYLAGKSIPLRINVRRLENQKRLPDQ